jgi:hypothetical protein
VINFKQTILNDAIGLLINNEEQDYVLSVTCVGPMIERYAGTLTSTKVLDKLSISIYESLHIQQNPFSYYSGSYNTTSLWTELLEWIASPLLDLTILQTTGANNNDLNLTDDRQVSFVTLYFLMIDAVFHQLKGYVDHQWDIDALAVKQNLIPLWYKWKECHSSVVSMDTSLNRAREKFAKIKLLDNLVSRISDLKRLSADRMTPTMDIFASLQTVCEITPSDSENISTTDLNLSFVNNGRVCQSYISWLELLLEVELLNKEMMKPHFNRWYIDSADLCLSMEFAKELRELVTTILKQLNEVETYISAFLSHSPSTEQIGEWSRSSCMTNKDFGDFCNSTMKEAVYKTLKRIARAWQQDFEAQLLNNISPSLNEEDEDIADDA